MRNHSYENDFDLHENETACRTHFHMKGFARRLVLKQRHKGTRKWPIKTISEYFPNISETSTYPKSIEISMERPTLTRINSNFNLK